MEGGLFSSHGTFESKDAAVTGGGHLRICWARASVLSGDIVEHGAVVMADFFPLSKASGRAVSCAVPSATLVLCVWRLRGAICRWIAVSGRKEKERERRERKVARHGLDMEGCT